MAFHREAAERGLDGALIGPALDAEELVIIGVNGHGRFPTTVVPALAGTSANERLAHSLKVPTIAGTTPVI
ncbi:hypothetical protein GCM10022281_21360 [Sphingomonas rosea]|uniref:Uncharacterized protein n=1 Tax=Sphingomonas rosea TaxID=335605 RepID=A0ABP7UCM1_9SPHN